MKRRERRQRRGEGGGRSTKRKRGDRKGPHLAHTGRQKSTKEDGQRNKEKEWTTAPKRKKCRKKKIQHRKMKCPPGGGRKAVVPLTKAPARGKGDTIHFKESQGQNLCSYRNDRSALVFAKLNPLGKKDCKGREKGRPTKSFCGNWLSKRVFMSVGEGLNCETMKGLVNLKRTQAVVKQGWGRTNEQGTRILRHRQRFQARREEGS